MLDRQVVASICLSFALAGGFACSDARAEHGWRKIVIDEQFFSEGAAVGDFNQDGSLDIVSGPFWYEGPEFRVRHRYAGHEAYAIAGYSDYFFSFVEDFDGDGLDDILAIPIPGEPAHWFRNPGHSAELWHRHLVLSDVSNESPTFTDIDGDSKPELICIHQGAYGYAKPDPRHPDRPWAFRPVTGRRGYGRFTHGLGVGDVDGDGRMDLLEKDGWWEQPEAPNEQFIHHAIPFAAAGGSQMFAYDFDGDGDNDIVSVQNAHAWGMKWFENVRRDGEIDFLPHEILPDRFDGRASLNISQMHALALADVDGDGVQDLVTGKRFYAHGGKDPGASQLPLLVWFRTVREKGGVRFVPHLIDERTGVGTQLSICDVNADGRLDVLVGNKLGTTLLVNREPLASPNALSSELRKIGTQEYAQAIRTSGPLTPQEELRTFVLPPGFQAQLVASEPVIAKPMNMAFDARGRLWVSSSEEYPYAAPDDRDGKDKIVILEDRDGDGYREHATTFADGLNIPMGLYPHGDGVIAFSIPNIWHLRDTDGDNRADVRTKLYGPMGFEADTHGMCNAFTRGMDGWLYACHGFNNRTKVHGADGHQIEMHSGNIFRMQIDGSRIEHYTHGLVNPFGMTQTEAGDWLVADCHTKPINLLLPGGYYDSFGKPHDGLGYVPNVMQHLHGSTAIGGIAQYNAEAFPAVYRGNTFGGNVMTGRVNRNSLQGSGASIRAREEPDFLISGDSWFRPVDLQIGPDGALYIADFYNRIIGHYEVDLEHPGRDRLRGRIWRIVYLGDSESEVVTPNGNSDAPSRDALDKARSGQWISDLSSPNQTRRRLAAEALIENGSSELIENIAELAGSETPETRSQALWILHRRSALSPELLRQAIKDVSPMVRNHAMRILEASADLTDESRSLVLMGLADANSTVRRAAVHASAAHAHDEFVKPLLTMFASTSAADPHLRHALKLALRNQLNEPRRFQVATQKLDSDQVPLVAEICLALKNAQAGAFVVEQLEVLASLEETKLAELVRLAARHADQESVTQLVGFVRRRFESNLSFQIELLRAAYEGIRVRNTQPPASLEAWAGEIVDRLLGIENGRLPADVRTQPAWVYEPHHQAPDEESPFVISRRRKAVDGSDSVPLISSFPKGESRTGIFRSMPFALPAEFHFFMAGHDGYPDQPLGGKNYVCLRDAKTQQKLKVWAPPRHDTAHRFEYRSTQNDPRRVYLEIVDGDTAGAFAWLAVGRFSFAELNQIDDMEQFDLAIQLIAELRLSSKRALLAELLENSADSAERSGAVGAAIAELQPSATNRAIATVLSIRGQSSMQRLELARIMKGTERLTSEVLTGSLRGATSKEQQSVANSLGKDRDGGELLMQVIEQGAVSAEVLRAREISQAFSAFGDPELLQRHATAIANLPSVSDEIPEAIANAAQTYSQLGGNPNAGASLFTKHCAVCHQVAGQGQQVGPNLDGIGNRGLNRLLEDVLNPSLNVDRAFRSTMLVTVDGSLHIGLLKESAGEQLTLIDAQGKASKFLADDIEQQKVLSQSPMPEDWAKSLTEEQLRNLMAWLLTQRN